MSAQLELRRGTNPNTRESPPASLSEKDLSLLLEATRLLSSFQDVEATIATVARLALPHLGSWCLVDLVENERMRRVAIIHQDPERQALTDQLLQDWPPQRDDPFGIPSAVWTGRSEIVFPVTEEVLTSSAGTADNLATLRALGIGALLTVPLLARRRVLGAITYIRASPGKSFTRRDLALAEELAVRCATAIDNAQLLEFARAAHHDAEAARNMAETANGAKKRFLSMMSHELRTPLNAIAGYADLLETGLRGQLTAAQLDDVRRIKANERHLLALVDSVLEYAKIDAGDIECGLENVMLAHVLADVGAMVAPIAADRRITCVGCAGGPGDDLVVYADAEKLRQILINLICNAIKFSHSDGQVEVTPHAARDEVEIRVTDRGPGVAPEHRETIFEPFVQVDGGMSRRHGGTGLGLAISRELAIGMGGSLSVESEVGTGSTFVLKLPKGRV
jgi:signal transduction histidine kinase